MHFAIFAFIFLVVSTCQLHAQPFAYITNSGTRNVSIIDTVDDTIKATVALPDTQQNVHPYAYGVTVGPSGQYVYVGLQDTNEVAVIDTASKTVVKRIDLGTESPGGLAVNRSETRLYVTSHFSNTLIIIDISGSVASVVDIVAVDDAQVSNPESVVLSPAEDKAYVANFISGTIAEISLDEINHNFTRTRILNLERDSAPLALAISADGTKLYAAGLSSDIFMVRVDDQAWPITRLFAGGGAVSLAMTPDKRKIFVPGYMLDSLVLIDELSFTDESWLYVNGGPFGSSVTPDGTKLYLTMNAMSTGDSVKVIDVVGNSISKTINLPVGSRPTSVGNFIGPTLPNTITATQSTNCSVFPLGAVAVNSFGRLFNITPTTGACEVKVDGISVGQPSSYKFNNVYENHTIEAVPLAGNFCTLTANWPDVRIPEGPALGCLESNPPGIRCNSKSAKYMCGTSVTLTAQSGYQATNWTGDCSGVTGNSCTLIMDSDRSAGATVAANTFCPVKIGSNCYSTLSSAVNAAYSGDIIKMIASYADSGFSSSNGPIGMVTISSGWNDTFSSQIGFTTVGSITVSKTGIIVDKLKIW